MTDKPTTIKIDIASKEISLDLSKQDAGNILKALLSRMGERVKITLIGFESIGFNSEKLGDNKK